MSILERYGEDDELKLEEVEKEVANRWRWEWLEGTVVVDPAAILPKLNWRKGQLTLLVKDTIRKINIPGKAVCTVCSADGYITYGGSGRTMLLDHLKTKKHVRRVVTALENMCLPGTTTDTSSSSYGAPAAYHDAPPSSREIPKPVVHELDRVANMEAMLVGFMAEHSLSFSMSERLVGLIKECAKDRPALQKLKMHRTTASYKLTHGLAKTVHDELIKKLQKTPFSINLDESTSTNTKHVLTVLVAYYEAKENNIVVEHLDSIDVPKCTSENLYVALKNMIEVRSIPWLNLLAMLSDSASAMRGEIDGLEVKLRSTVAPHLLDVDGESCHHMHNIVKKFVSHFEHFLENLFRDISTEFKFSADNLSYLKEFAFHLGIKFRKPDNFIMARWLSVLDTSLEFHYLLDAHKLMFSAFEKAYIEQQVKRCDKEVKKLSEAPKSTDGKDNDVPGSGKKPLKTLKKEKSKYLRKEKQREKREVMLVNKYNLSDASKTTLSQLMDDLGKKYKNGTTDKGKDRKVRIFIKLNQQNKYRLLTSLYQAVLPLFKAYVMLFQSEKPLIHKIYYKQIECIKTFFSYFVKPDVLVKCKTGTQLLHLDLKKENLLPKELIFIGKTAKQLVDSLGCDHVDVVDFLDKTLTAYANCGLYIQKKLPVESKLLKALSAIDPLFVTSANALILTRLLSLPQMIKNILSDEEEEVYEKEVRLLLVDSDLPPAMDDDGKNEVDCLTWWSSISATYPCIFRMVTTVLSIFHGPRVESSFNIMGDVIDAKSGRINMHTYSAYQNVKYALQARHPAAATSRSVNLFCRKQRLYTPVNPTLATNMRQAFSLYKAAQKKNNDEKLSKQEEFNVQEDESTTRKKLKVDNVKDSQEAQMRHQEILDAAYKPKRSANPPTKENIHTDGTNPKRKLVSEECKAVEDSVEILEDVLAVSDNPAVADGSKKVKLSKPRKKQSTVDCFFKK